MHRLEHAGQQFLGLGQADPADLGQLGLIADVDVRPMGRPGREVDHPLACDRVDALAEALPDPHGEAGLLLYLADDRVLRALSWLAPASDIIRAAPGGINVICLLPLELLRPASTVLLLDPELPQGDQGCGKRSDEQGPSRQVAQGDLELMGV